jgi:hypothetical protein
VAFWFDPPGPELAFLSRVEGWRSATDAVEEFTPEELALLNRRLPHEGGEGMPRNGILMSGDYVVEFDLSPFTLPPVDEDRWTQGWWIEPIAFHVTRDLAPLRAASLAYDPVPTNETMNARVRFTRAVSNIHLSWVVDENTAEGTLSIPTLTVARLGARVYGWRDWWDECALDAP